MGREVLQIENTRRDPIFLLGLYQEFKILLLFGATKIEWKISFDKKNNSKSA